MALILSLFVLFQGAAAALALRMYWSYGKRWAWAGIALVAST